MACYWEIYRAGLICFISSKCSRFGRFRLVIAWYAAQGGIYFYWYFIKFVCYHIGYYLYLSWFFRVVRSFVAFLLAIVL